MTYQELKVTNIFSFKNLDEVKGFISKILQCDKDEIIKYINYLKWYEYNDASIKEMKFISKFLSMDGLSEIVNDCDIELGNIEDLSFEDTTEEKESDIYSEFKAHKQTNTIFVDDTEYNVFGIFEDDFESIYVIYVDGALKHYGTVTRDGKNYIYELPEEPEEFLWETINSPLGSKVNFNSHYTKDSYVKKTFRKVDKEIAGTYVSTNKSNYGVMSPVIGGTYSVVCSEETYSSVVEKSAEDIANEKYKEYVSKYEEKYVNLINQYKAKLAEYEGTTENSPEKLVEKMNAQIAEKISSKEDHSCSCGRYCEEDEKE